MPLRYLPFRNEPALEQASRNAPVLKQGARGTAVATLQQALIDYGLALPKSIRDGSTDGIFGRETRDKIAFFQGRNNLGVDGAVGRNTMGALDHTMTVGIKAQRTRKVTLHFRSLAETKVPFDTQLRSAQKVFAQYNIEIVMGSGVCVGLSEADAKKFAELNGSCEWEITTGEYKDLLSTGTNVPQNHIAVFLIDRFEASEGILGCGGHLKGHPACIVAGNANRYDMAHEVAHVLLTSAHTPVHHPSTKNLMHETQAVYPTTPVLDQKQLAKIRSSPLCF